MMAASTVFAIRHVGFEDLGILEEVFQQRGFSVQYWDAGIDDLSALQTSEADIVVALGGPLGANDDARYPWLSAERDFLIKHINSGTPILGICLGAQLLAQILGGQVQQQSAPEIGWAPVSLTPLGQNSLLQPVADLPVLHWHGDGFVVPEPVEVLASTELCPQQAFGWRPSQKRDETAYQVLGLQFHIEAQSQNIERWCIGHAHELAAHGCDLATIRSDSASYGPQLQPIAQDILHTWLDQLLRAGYLGT